MPRQKINCFGCHLDYIVFMPELPEVEIVRRALEPVLIEKDVEFLKFNRPDLRFPLPQDLPKKFEKQKIKTLLRRGKYIVGFAENHVGFILHLGMSGVVRIEHENASNENLKHDHVELMMKNNVRIVLNDPRRFGFFIEANQNDWQSHPTFIAMGPEPLGNDFNGPVLFERLKGRKTSIKAALLDQRIVAGIGNIYACEALYESGISPFMAAGRLSNKACETLAQNIKAVLLKALDAGGSSLKDYKHTDGNLGYFQHQFHVYDREGVPCSRCGCDTILIQRKVQNGRSTFYCSSCQNS